MSIFCIIAVRNEARYLPGFLHHIADHVDGVVALDDCSTDRTIDILKSDPRVVSVLREDRDGPPHANETRNRHRLLVEAARLGARWVICADADERFEEAFLRRLPEEADHGERTGHLLRFIKIVNLWNSPKQYRADGLCGPRWTVRMFKVPDQISKRPAAMHRPWFPPDLDDAPKARMNAYLYHLTMMDRRDREIRFEKFRAIDPDNQHQAVGYRHLIDEADLQLRPILPWRRYNDLDAELARGRAPMPAGTAAYRPIPVPTLPERALFDETVYLTMNPDVRQAVAEGGFETGWQHFTRHGFKEGRIWQNLPRFKGLDFGAIFQQWRNAKS